jgi:hypothetical protein
MHWNVYAYQVMNDERIGALVKEARRERILREAQAARPRRGRAVLSWVDGVLRRGTAVRRGAARVVGQGRAA